jgi:hypothetical protein
VFLAPTRVRPRRRWDAGPGLEMGCWRWDSVVMGPTIKIAVRELCNITPEGVVPELQPNEVHAWNWPRHLLFTAVCGLYKLLSAEERACGPLSFRAAAGYGKPGVDTAVPCASTFPIQFAGRAGSSQGPRNWGRRGKNSSQPDARNLSERYFSVPECRSEPFRGRTARRSVSLLDSQGGVHQSKRGRIVVAA